MKTLDIAQVIKNSGLPASTLRYYEQQGLIKAIGRKGLRRQYHDSVLQQLALIKLGQIGGFSLQEIALILNKDGQFTLDRQQLNEKAQQLDGMITQLTMVRDGLKHVASCPSDNHLECPSFQKLLKYAFHQTSFTTILNKKP